MEKSNLELGGLVQAGSAVKTSTDKPTLADIATTSYDYLKAGEPAEPVEGTDFSSVYGEHGGQVLETPIAESNAEEDNA
jgi:hypothetical protein